MQESEAAHRAGPGAARADRRAARLGAEAHRHGAAPTWRASTTFCTSTIPTPRSMAWSPTCRCAWANRWCRACRTQTGSIIMTIADMSLITAEVKVDETDIVNVKLGQPAEITIDAIPNKIFKGHVTEIGDTAILRSTGVAASQSAISSQEAKDFKVVIALDNPPDEIRPGPFLHRQDHHGHAPERADHSDPGADRPAEGRSGSRSPSTRQRRAGGHQARSGGGKGPKEEIQGVFVVAGRQGRVPQSGDRHHRRHRYRSAERAEGRRPDHHRHLPGDPHHRATTRR